MKSKFIDNMSGNEDLTRQTDCYRKDSLASLSSFKIIRCKNRFLTLMISDTSSKICNDLFEFFQIKFYRIYRIYRNCRRLFLVILIFKISKNSEQQNLQNLQKTIISNFHFQNHSKQLSTNSIDSVGSIKFNSEKLDYKTSSCLPLK